jgi:formate dehydrogenase accessory protein FdhE
LTTKQIGRQRPDYDAFMRDEWERRINRAERLAAQYELAGPLMLVYSRLLGLQRDCDEILRRRAEHLTGSLDRDLPALRPCIVPTLRAVMAIGPVRLVDEARRTLDQPEAATDAALLAAWHSPSGHSFFPRIVLQPYAQCLASMQLRPADRDLPSNSHACPFCGGAPQLAILQSAGSADGGGRQLLCGTCFTTWPFRRVLCVQCGEEDEHRLGYFHTAAFDHLRVDACDSCQGYLKTVDLTRLGIAVPVVDEVAGAPLDLWAVDRGYQKIELNLVGL